jgi:hypothetical protein
MGRHATLGALAALCLAGCDGSPAAEQDAGTDGGARDAAFRDAGSDSRDAAIRDGSVADASRDASMDASKARIVLGTGTAEFEPLPPEGGELEIDTGGQGRWHVYASVQLFGVDPLDRPLRYTTAAVETGDSVTDPKEVLLTDFRITDRGDHWERLGDRLILKTSDPNLVTGTKVKVTAAFEPDSGASITDTRTVTLVDRE